MSDDDIVIVYPDETTPQAPRQDELQPEKIDPEVNPTPKPEPEPTITTEQKTESCKAESCKAEEDNKPVAASIGHTSSAQHWFTDSSSSSSVRTSEDGDDDEIVLFEALGDPASEGHEVPPTHEDVIDNPDMNIYIDERTMKVQFNSESQQFREQLSAQVVANYVECARMTKSPICTLDDVLDKVDIPADATHVSVTFCNFDGDQFFVPYSLKHRSDPFPMSDTELVTDCSLVYDLPRTVTLVRKSDTGDELVEENITTELLHYAWYGFQPAFTTHRPYAWGWLSELSDDPNAVIVAKFVGDVYVTLSLADFSLVRFTA